jgi:helix-turn-helix protein
MSTDSVSLPKHQTVSAAERADWAMLLAREVRQRREELGLSVKRAAELSGMETSEWYVLEIGWVPSVESGLLDSIAGALQTCHIQLPLMAEISRYNQEVLFNSLSHRVN